jgi:hypothetical protein
MTDQELLELAATKTPEALTADEIAALRAALPRLPELRQNLAERLAMERLLYAGLTPSQVSAAAVIAHAQSRPWLGRGRLWGLVASALVAIGGIALFWFANLRSANDETIARLIISPAATDAKPVAPMSVEASDEKSAPATPPVAKDQAVANDQAGVLLAAANAPAAAVETAPVAPQPPTTATTAAPPAAKPATPAEPTGPWTPLATVLTAPAPDAESLASDLTPATPAPKEAELREWLAEVAGKEHNFSSHTHWNVPCGVFSGVLRLKSPWAPQAALRLSLHDFHRLRIHLWGERDGVTLQYSQSQNRSWFAYRATRKAGEQLPETLVLAATDEFRNARVNWNDTATIELACDGKMLTLSRRNVRLLAVPFEGLPRETFFEGHAVVRQMQLVRAVELAPEPASGPVVFDAPEPAKQDWRTELGEGAAFNLLADGRVELMAEKTNKATWASLPLANDSLQEVIMELEDPQPGTGVFLGDGAGKSNGGLSFYREQHSGRRAVGHGNPNDGRTETQFDERETLASFCPAKPWVKMLLGCGVVRFWISADGQHWARACDPWTQQYAGLASVGLYCAPGSSAKSIKLRRITTRALPGLAALAPPELQRRAPEFKENHTPQSWLHAIYASQPSDVDASAWRRACALRSLATNAPHAALSEELDNLLEDVMAAKERPWQERLAALNDAAQLRPYWEDAWQTQRMLAQFARFGAQVAAEGHPEAVETVLHAQLTAPLWCRHSHVPGLEDVDREQIVQMVYAEAWNGVEALTRQLRLTRQIQGDQAGMLNWADALAPTAAARAAGKPLMKPEWRHPLVAELSKEAYNVLAELEAALAGKSYRDACQIISTAAADGGPGLLPDSHDPRLLLSFPMAVSLALREHPQLSATMNEQFGGVGRLRVRQAIADDDLAAIESATVQFTGTEAAAEAHLWLADRALAAGAFAQALAHYRESGAAIGAQHKDRVTAGAQLAAALMGETYPGELNGPLSIGDNRIPVAEFTRMLDDLRSRHVVESMTSGAQPTDAHVAPAPSGFETQVRGQFDGQAGDSPQNLPGEMKPFDIDWVGRQLTFAVSGDRLILNNRFQVSAFNLKTHQYDWRTPLTAEQAGAHDWPLMPMRPLVTGNRIFVRQLAKPGPLLQCLDAQSGKLLWTSKSESDKFVVSDPILVQEQLFALTATRADQEFALALSGFDPASGAVVSSRPLVRLREQWWQQRACEVTPLDDTLLIAVGGSVMRVDLLGRIHWLRRQTWRPATLDRSWLAQSQTPPLAAEGRVFVAQPGVGELLALDAQSGRLAWQTPLANLRRILGLVGERLVVETSEGLAGLSIADGAIAWKRPIAKLLEGYLLSKDRLLVTRNEPIGDNSHFAPQMIWIDPLSGQELARWSLDGLRHERPRLGPVLMAQDRLFVLAGRGEQETQREILELAPREEAGKPPASQSADDAVWRRQVDRSLVDASADVLPKWTVLGGNIDRHQPLKLVEWQGEKQVLEIQATPGRPFSLARRVKFPAGAAKLALRVASDAKWKLEVQVAGKPPIVQKLTRETTGGGWKDLEIDLSDLAGQATWLLVRQIDEDGSQPVVRWKSLELRN